MKENLQTIVNASGFLFQLRVNGEVEQTQRRHGWRVLASEHPWRSVQEARDGYIDLVLDKAGVRLVIECKRTRNGSWVFLVPDVPDRGSLIRSLQFTAYDTGLSQARWQDFMLIPNHI